MNWQVKVSDQTLIIKLPDRLPTSQPFTALIGERSVTAEWHPNRGVLSFLDNGVYRNISLRNAKATRFPGESQSNVSSASWQGQMIYADASVEAWVPGSANRAKARAAAGHVIRSQITGKILKVLVKQGDQVEPGQTLLVIEAMKMENKIFAPAAGKVTKLSADEGANISVGAELARIE
jgi:biotin carboxyl carrier protein